MATEVSDLNVIQDEDTLRKMWQQTEDFGRKKEIRLRMYRLREERLKSYYITRETTNSTVTDHKTSTSSHAESLSDQGFLTMKTKEIRDSASPTLDLKQSSQLAQICSSNDKVDANANVADRRYRQTSRIEDLTNSNSNSYSRHESSQQREYENKSFQKTSQNTTSALEREPSSFDFEYDSRKLEKNVVVDVEAVNMAAETERRNVREDSKTQITNRSSRDSYDSKTTATTTTTRSPSSAQYETVITSSCEQQGTENGVQPKVDVVRESWSSRNATVNAVGSPSSARYETVTASTFEQRNENSFQPIDGTRSVVVDDSVRETSRRSDSRNDYSSSRHESKTTNATEITTRTDSASNVDALTNVDKSIMNELHKLDSYLLKEANAAAAAAVSPAPSSPRPQTPNQEPKTQGDYATTYQQAYGNNNNNNNNNCNKISQDVSVTHNAFASSLRASPTPSGKRSSSERSSPEKTPRASPEKHAATYAFRRENVRNRHRASTSECDSDDSSATYNKKIDRKLTVAKRVETTTKTTRHHQKQQQRENQFSSEGSVERETKKYAKSPNSSPERSSAFRPVNVVAAAASSTQRFHAETRRQSFPQTPTAASSDEKPKHRVHADERSYSEKIDVRRSPIKSAKPASAVTRTDHNIPQRAVSAAKMADKTEYTASYTSPARDRSPQKTPYDYASIRPQPQSRTPPSSTAAPANETFVSSKKIEPTYRVAAVPTVSQTASSPVASGRESDAATTTATRNAIRKSATSPPKTERVSKKTVAKPKEDESQSESSETDSSTEDSDVEESQVTIEDVTESGPTTATATATATTLDDFIESDDDILKQNAKLVDEFDLIKEEKTTPLDATTKAGGVEEFLRQERIVKEGEIDGSIPPAEVVLGKEAAKLLKDSSFVSKERDQAAKSANRKAKETVTQKKASTDAAKSVPAVNAKSPGTEKRLVKRSIPTADCATPNKSNNVERVVEKQIAPRKQTPNESSKPSTLGKSATVAVESRRPRKNNSTRNTFDDSTRKKSQTDGKANVAVTTKIRAAVKKIDSKVTLKESVNLPEKGLRGREKVVAAKSNETKILKKYKSDKDVYKKQSDKKYRRTESDKPLRTDATKTSSTLRTQNPTSSRSLRGYEKPTQSSRNGTRYSETAKENIYRENSSKNVVADKVCKTARTGPPASSSSSSSSPNTSTPGYAKARKTTTTRTQTDGNVVTKSTATAAPVTPKKSAPSSNNRARKDTPKPQQITINVSDRPSFRPRAVASPSISVSKDKLKKGAPAKSAIFETTSSSSSSELDLVDVEARDGEDAQEANAEIVDVAEKVAKGDGETPHRASSDSQHLNVIVRMPSSSRETTPKLNDEQFCTVVEDGGSPRYADRVIEPEDAETVRRIVIPRFEKITDLDENDEEDEASHNVSVADRVSKFLENAKEADVKQANLATDQVFQNQTVNQTKEIFESIAKGTIKTTSTSSPSPQQQQPPPPIANRPSVFEHKRLSESIKEEEDETAHGHGHDGPHKIVSKKLTDRDYDDYVAEHLSEVGQVDQRTESATHSNFTNKEKLESEKKEVAGSAKIAQKACDEADRGTVQTPRKPKSPTRVQPKSAHSNTLSAADHRRYEHTSEVGQHVVEQTSNKSTSATPRVKLDSRDSPVPAPVPAPSKVRTQSRETSPTKGGDANKKCVPKNAEEKDNVVGKTTVQRYESRKFSDKLSPKPIEMTTVEVRPSKHVYDHTAITTVDACDKYSYKTNSVKQETRKSPSPSSKQKSPSPVRVAPTNKKSEKLVSTTSATDYENRKQFFENKERADRQKSSKHYQNDTAATVSRKRCGSGKTSSPEKESSFDATTAGERRSPEKTRSAAPFGVSLKKTTVNATTTSSSSHRKTTNSDALTDDEKKVEEIFDLQLLEAMLEKAARYDLRSRIRAQIRLVRRQMELKSKKSSRTPSPEKSPAKDEIKRISSHQPKTTVNEITQVAIDRRDKVKKQLFTEDKLEGKTKQQTIARDDFIKSAANSSKKHVSGVKCKSPVDENDGETTTTYRRSFGTTTTGATVRNTSRNNVEARSTTDRIISGYGVGPTDEQGKPLFGLKALRTSNDADDKSSTREDHASKTVVKRRESQEITDRSGKPLFGLKALQRSAQRSENYVTTTSSHAHHHSTNRSSDDKFGSSSTSSSTVYSSRTAMKSDNNGNLSILRDEVKGEIHSKNGQLPTGTMTRNQIAYEKPLNKEATVRTSSSTRILNGEKEREHSSRTQRQRFDTGDDHLDSKCKSVSSALPSVDDDGWKSKFNTSSSLIRRISNEHFEKAQRKFNATTSTDENRRDSIEKEHEKLTSARHSNTERNERKTQLERDNSLREIKSKFQQATVSSSMKQVTRLADDGNDNHNHNGQDKQSCENRCEHFDQRLKHASSFNQRHSEYSENQAFSITANHDATQRVSANATGMGGGQLADEEIQTACLANKFVGGSISLQGLKVISSADSNSFSTSVGKFENQNKTNQNLGELNVDQISDEEELRNLLEACTDYEKRRVIRAKLRNIMADRKGYTESIQSAENVNATADTNANATHTNESTEVAETSSTSITTTKNETFSSSIQVHSKTSSTGRIVKANSVTSPFAKFRQLERQNSFPSSGAPIFKFTDPKLTRSASSIKDRLLNWVKAQTKDYKNVQIDNFSTSWNNGLAFCALIHHFCPHAFDYNKLMPEQRRYNFELAFRVAEQEAGIVPLLDVEDMVIMKRPDWKCVFTYVQSVYQRFHASPEANRP